MAGYMGFGMASWIYKQRPRKVFSKRRRRPTCNTLSSYDRKFKLQYASKPSKLTLLLSLLLISLVLSIICFKAPVLVEQSHTVYALKQERLKHQNEEAFKFLIRSGSRRLYGRNFIGAYSEFKLAYQIYPKDEHLQRLLMETLCMLCDQDSIYCKDLDAFLNSSLELQ